MLKFFPRNIEFFNNTAIDQECRNHSVAKFLPRFIERNEDGPFELGKTVTNVRYIIMLQ